MEWLKGKKTYIVVILGLLIQLVNFLVGDLSLIDFLTSDNLITTLGFLGLGTLRAGIKNEDKFK